MEFEEKKEGLGWKFRKICMSIQTNVAPGSVLYRFRGVTTMIPTKLEFSLYRIEKHSSHVPISCTTTTVSLQSVNVFKDSSFFYLKSNSEQTCFYLSLFNMCISTCFLFTSVGWCNVQVNLKCIHKDKYDFKKNPPNYV